MKNNNDDNSIEEKPKKTLRVYQNLNEEEVKVADSS
jgi:hypothetical protein